MASIHDVAAQILVRGPMSVIKLQRLCYFSYGYHLAWEGRRLFPERFHAWASGPFAPALNDRHPGQFNLRAGDVPGDPTALDDCERESVKLVIDGMHVSSAWELSAMARSTQPWVLTRTRAGAAPLERVAEELEDADIADYFGVLVDKLRTPASQPVHRTA